MAWCSSTRRRDEETRRSLHTAGAERALRDYYAAFFGPHGDPTTTAWVMEQVVRTPPHVTSSVWEESIRSWDDAEALRRCRVPLLYIDAGTPNADLARAASLAPQLVVGRTVGSGHFSPLEVPEQVNAMLARFFAVSLDREPGRTGSGCRQDP
jgi:pimeloyl-ACP methyl ester carboxylesterase